MHCRTGKLANTVPCFKEVASTKHIRGSCQLRRPNRLQLKEVRSNFDTPGNTHKGLELHHCCSRCPAALQTLEQCVSQTGVASAAWMPQETQQAEIVQLTLALFLICSYMCLSVLCEGREDLGFSRCLGTEGTGIKTSTVVLKEWGKSRACWDQARRGSETSCSTERSPLPVAQLCSCPSHHQQRHPPAQDAHVL